MPRNTSQRIVIVGGGVAGLSTAVRLVQSGLPVTVLERSKIGAGASTRNQGWLHSGALFATTDTELARQCYSSSQQTIEFCPDCCEPQHTGMAYIISKPDTRSSIWTEAWTRAGLPYDEIPLDELFQQLPGLAREHIQRAFLLPDRAIRTDVLLTRLEATAKNAGVEVRTKTPVKQILGDGNVVSGVKTGTDEEISARMVILAGGASGTVLLSELMESEPGRQSEFTRALLKTHLVAIKPDVGRLPFCIVDAEGFNHIPHAPSSVFGLNRWLSVSSSTDQKVIPTEIDHLWTNIDRFFPDLDRENLELLEWSGTTVEAMHVEQIEPGKAPLPTVIDHSEEKPATNNLLSIFPGRATLWAQLAEQTRSVVLNRLEHSSVSTSTPPWTTAG